MPTNKHTANLAAHVAFDIVSKLLAEQNSELSDYAIDEIARCVATQEKPDEAYTQLLSKTLAQAKSVWARVGVILQRAESTQTDEPTACDGCKFPRDCRCDSGPY